jgi:hypothetical protein
MLKSKFILYALIASFFVLGVYEKKMGDVLDVPYHSDFQGGAIDSLNQTTYICISGDLLIVLAVGLMVLCSYAMERK